MIIVLIACVCMASVALEGGGQHVQCPWCPLVPPCTYAMSQLFSSVLGTQHCLVCTLVKSILADSPHYRYVHPQD